jgi:LysM repeat protein
MKFHIVRNGETVNEIVFLYGLETDELKKENKHIRYWDKLIPGTKLRIPTISEAVELDIASMEPFIEDYYPKLKLGEELKPEKTPDYDYQEIDDYVIKSTKNNNIQTVEEIKTQEEQINIEEIKDPEPAMKEVTKKVEPVEEDEETEEEVPLVQPTYYPYYPYYPYNRYSYPKVVYPVYVYPAWRY